VLEADPVSAGDSERVDVVEREVLDVSVKELVAEKRGVQHLPRRPFELSAATADLIPQMLLPDSQVFETDVVIGPGLDYGTVRRRSMYLAATLGQRGRHRLLSLLD
jgi:hypothetical protein